jgi:hypothetical protein
METLLALLVGTLFVGGSLGLIRWLGRRAARPRLQAVAGPYHEPTRGTHRFFLGCTDDGRALLTYSPDTAPDALRQAREIVRAYGVPTRDHILEINVYTGESWLDP